MARFEILIVAVCVWSFASGFTAKSRREPPAALVNDDALKVNVTSQPSNCACGVFLSSQMVKDELASKDEIPPITIEIEDQVTCGSIGAASDCSKKCLDEMVKYLPNSAKMICGALDRDVYKEKASLFVDVCNQGWTKTKLSTTKQICCKDSVDYKCPRV